MPPDGPELEEQRELRKQYDNEWPNIFNIITGSTSLEPVPIDTCLKQDDASVSVKSVEDMAKEATQSLERNYTI